MIVSSEQGPRCACRKLAEIIEPGVASCCGRLFPFTIERRAFYVTDTDDMREIVAIDLTGGGKHR